ncbi:MAG: hypothetical protein A2Z81_04160, partial [Omnitrophica WOR_2 bacterium GWA2_45_18]
QELKPVTSIIREIIIPEIEKEVNEGKNFAPLRQIYYSLILAKWYKETVKNSLLSKVYVDQNKITGVNLDDPAMREKIYDRYMEAYKKGVYDYIKEDYDAVSQEVIPRKYFSGGEVFHTIPLKRDPAALVSDLTTGKGATMTVDLAVLNEPNKNAGIKDNALLIKVYDETNHLVSKEITDFDAEIKSMWEQKRQEGVLKNDVSKIQRMRIGNFQIRFKEDSPINTVLKQPLGIVKRAFNEAEFNFNKIAIMDQRLFQIDLNGNAARIHVDNGPDYKYHFLVLPEAERNHSQLIQGHHILTLLKLMRFSGSPNLKFAHNSWGGGAAVNHLHIHGIYYPEGVMPVENAGLEQIRVYPSNVTVNKLVDYPAKGFVFRGEDIVALAEVSGNFIKTLQEKNIPYNLFISRQGIYVLPRRFGTVKIMGQELIFGYQEMSGEVELPKELFERIKGLEEKTARQILAEAIRAASVDDDFSNDLAVLTPGEQDRKTFASNLENDDVPIVLGTGIEEQKKLSETMKNFSNLNSDQALLVEILGGVAGAGVGLAVWYQIWIRYTVKGNLHRLKSDSFEVREAAIRFLEDLKDERVVEPLIKMLDDNTHDPYAIRVLEKFGDERTTTLLSEALEEAKVRLASIPPKISETISVEDWDDVTVDGGGFYMFGRKLETRIIPNPDYVSVQTKILNLIYLLVVVEINKIFHERELLDSPATKKIKLFSLPAGDTQSIIALIKPEISQSKEAIQDTLSFFWKQGYTLQNMTLWKGEALKEIIPRHYGLTAKVSVEGKKYLDSDKAAKQAFMSKFNSNDDKYRNLVIKGGQELIDEGYTLEEVSKAWREANQDKSNPSFQKLKPEVYAAKVNLRGQEMYLLNGHYPAMLAHFTKPEAVTVSFELIPRSREAVPLTQLKASVGPSNIFQASMETLRGQLFNKRAELGIKDLMETSVTILNCVHLSASWLDALRESTLWGGELEKQPLALKLNASGVSIERLEQLLAEKPPGVFDGAEELTSQEEVVGLVLKQENIKSDAGKKDFASIAQKERLASTEDVGGIDMNSIDLNRQGAGAEIQFDPSVMSSILENGVEGFRPVIINFTPITSILPLLGLEPKEREESYEVSRSN